MAVRVCFELGHEASVRTKKTPEGFTHDWEVFVRPADGSAADIAHFIDKVVFQLHDTFPQPRRVVKEPPYSVKESGYAGFNLPIEIYLKNRDEPKKIKFNYDLSLQPSGPPLKKVRSEPYLFTNPSDEFRRKLLKGGGTVMMNPNSHSNLEHERNSRDSFTDVKKHKKEYRIDDVPRTSNTFENLFGPTIHKPSRISPDPKKPSPNSKIEKKDKEKEKSYAEKDKQKAKIDPKEKDPRSDRDLKRDDRSKDEKRKSHKDKDVKDKAAKRLPERTASPIPPIKKPNVLSNSPKRVSSPSNKSNSSASSKEEVKSAKHNIITDIKIKNQKPPEITPPKMEKKLKKEKKSHERDRDGKKEYKKEKDASSEKDNSKSKEIFKESLKEIPVPVKEKPAKPINKFSIENMLKDNQDTVKYYDNSTKHKDKSEREKKHKHKKKDKKRDESREKNKDSFPKDKKHKNEKKVDGRESFGGSERNEIGTKDMEKNSSTLKLFKEKDRSQLTISPISVDTSSQSSSKSLNKNSKPSKNPLSSMMEDLSRSSCSDSDSSVLSEDEDNPVDNGKNGKIGGKSGIESIRNEPVKIQTVSETLKTEKQPIEKNEKPSQFSNHKSQKGKEKPIKQETKEDKKQRKRKSTSKEEENTSKLPKTSDDIEHNIKKRSENVSTLENSQKIKSEPSRSKTDTKVQDDGVSSSLSDNHIKCESPIIEDSHMPETHEISPDYMIQLRELQKRIMNLQNNEELERVVNLIAETGKYEVTKKTFDFDLCVLDRSTVQQLQELIGCESRA